MQGNIINGIKSQPMCCI